MAFAFRPHVPRTLRTRLFLILLLGLASAQALSFGILFLERYTSSQAMMLGSLESDVETTVALIDRLPPEERAAWAAQVVRRTYRYEIGPGLPGEDRLSPHARDLAALIRTAVGSQRPVVVQSIPGLRERVQAHVTLTDGSLLTIDITPSPVPLATWLPWVLALELIVLLVCAWVAVRLAIRPLSNLAAAAESLEPGRLGGRLNESGPLEVASAARAFNGMQDRITHYLEERAQILAAISHDLQTPITRMKLRAEMSDEGPDRDKLLNDLSEIETLVKEGVAYARSAQGYVEAPLRVDLSSLIESIALDYQDMGRAVTATPLSGAVATTRPHAMRRILSNLVDNGLKFAGEVEIGLHRRPGGFSVLVLDRGPGIPESQLSAVLEPFYRLERSRSRDTGGTGLGLAISAQLADSIGGSLHLRNRRGGGLAVEVRLG